ncbi:ArnT family glycosyltransferase [Portibacter marinus]|uniref:ArnT family glycosyltransferase n=1 Tax=Portibacter marinus TaxID=2898660 RepID=UPI001F419E68|nr:glycosyltransferase family 39 protein [Portibacter marinus]
MENRTIYFYFALAWLALFTLQAWWTPPHIDELYYWRFSQYLDWGYFDHPPMVALMIWFSDLIFSGNLAIRATTVLMTMVSIYLVWKMVDQPSKTKSFWYVVFSLPLLHLYGFITTPDVPLLFFSALFFLCYQKILENDRWKDYLLWGLIMGLLLYSKYHGALLIIFTLLAHPRLFLNPKTYLAGLLGILIWAPHVWWQYEHQWMTFNYHLSERVGDFKWFYPLEYLGNLLVVFNPFFILFLVKVIKKTWNNQFEKTCYFVLIGFLVFFGFHSFRDHVQPQWLVLTYVPFIYLLIKRLDGKGEKRLRLLFLISSPLLIALHVFMTFDLLKTDGGIWRKDQFAAMIAERAGNRPVVFFDSYQDPSIYEWYRPSSISHSFNRASKRKNQFNIWLQDTLMNESEIFVFAPDRFKVPDFLVYQSFDKLKVMVNKQGFLVVQNPYDYAFQLGEGGISIDLLLYKDKKVIETIPMNQWALKDPNDVISIRAQSDTVLNFKTNPPPDTKADEYGYSIKMPPWPGAAVYYRYRLGN